MATPEGIFGGSSEMGALMRSLDWSQTPLGPLETWSQSLRTSISICLSSRFPILLWWGPELVMLYNDAYRPILGIKHPRSMGQRGRDCWVEIWDVIGPMLEGVLLTGKATWSENQLLLLDRHGYLEECYFTFSYSPIADETGSTGGVFTAVTETTRQVLGERRLQTLRDLAANTAKAKTVEEAYGATIAALDCNINCIPFALLYRIESGNQAHLAGITGLEAGTDASPTIVNLSQPQAWPFEPVQATGQPQRVENLGTRFGELFDNNGMTLARDAILLPLTQAGDKQQVIGFLVLGISPKLAFDSDYQSFFDLVAGSVETAIADAEAYEAERKRAEALAELDRAKTTFFSNVSHEFRTPLTLMLGPLEAALKRLNGQLPPAEREQLEMVHRNGQRLLKLVNTLLDFARIEAGRIQAVYEPTDLATFTAELASVFRSAIEQAGLRLVVDCPPLPEQAYVDREMWEKIVLNLLSNAFKFTFEGEIVVALRVRDTRIELEVRDTGIGIPPQELPHIFERFHQVKGARGRSYEGSGIGLSFVQELVRLQGGTINVTSTIHEGTCFTISIPTGCAHLPSESLGAPRTLSSTAIGAIPYVEEVLHWLPERGSGFTAPEVQRATVLQTEVNPESSIQPLTPNPQSAHILLVDDNADMRDYVQRLLSDQYQVETATDGISALATIHQKQPDLVLTDVMMPGLDGFGFIRSLRDDPHTQELPIILLSARAGEEARIEGLEAGADDYLIKPFSARELLARIEATLKLAQLRRDASQREQTLRLEAERAKQRVETILSSISDGVYTFDRNWRYTYVNDRLCEIVGKSREELLGYCIWEVFPEAVETEVYVQFQRAMQEQIPLQFEGLYLPWNRWFEHHLYPTPDGLTIFSTEVTARKQAEIALQVKSAELRHVTETAGIGLVRCSRDFRYLSANPAYAELVGLSVNEIVGRLLTEVIGESALEMIRPYIDRVLQGERVEYEAQVPFAAGGMQDLYVVYTPDKDENGTVIGWIASIIDIGNRKQAELALRASEALARTRAEELETLMEVVPVGIWLAHDPDCHQVTVNRAAYQLMQAEPGEATTATPADGTYPFKFKLQRKGQDIPPEDLSLQKAARTGQEVLEEAELVFEDGVVHYLYGRAVPLRNEAGNVRGVIGAYVDISERKQAEAEREQLLAREQAARESAEATNRIKDEFLAVLSHELRSPLNPILGWSRLLQNGKLDETRTQQALATIERNARLQAELIEDLLDVSRILQGKLSLKVNPINLTSTIQAAIETVRLAAEAKSIQIKTHFDPAVGMVSGDSTRLQQVVWNLLSNAVKFTPSGGDVTVQLERIDNHAQITVRDTGKGISPDFLPHVFDYFRQEDGTTTRKFGGLGLGLAIVRYLVELHGGTVQAHSPGEGRGAIFTVKLPLMLHQPPINRDTPPSEPSLNLQGIRILVVDDDSNTREFLTFLLNLHGAKVSATSSAAEAIRTLTQFKPNVLLSDIGMPDVDGYMLMQQVRALPPEQGGTIPAIALTAYAGEIDYRQAMVAGFQRHLPKPVEPEELIKVISTLCHGRALSPEAI